MAKLVLNNISSGYASATALDANFTAIEAALENTLSRDGTSPNTMSADLDMNGFRILNELAATGEGFIWEGAWVSTTVYQINNLVQINGNTYICTTAHTATVFADNLASGYWELLVAKGADGTGGGDVYIVNNLSEFTATASTARGNISAAKSGANSDITSLTGLTTALSATQGGTAQTTYTTGDILYASASNTLSKLAKGTTGQILTQGASVPSWATPTKEVVQIVNTTSSAVTTGTTTIPFDDTIPQNTEGTEFITLAITPTNASNILHIQGSLLVGSSDNVHIIAALFQDSTLNALAAVTDFQSTANAVLVIDINHYMVAGTTSATTFKIRVGGNIASTLTLNGNGGTRLFGALPKSSMSITEISA